VRTRRFPASSVSLAVTPASLSPSGNLRQTGSPAQWLVQRSRRDPAHREQASRCAACASALLEVHPRQHAGAFELDTIEFAG